MVVKGAPLPIQLLVDNDETELPAGEDLANDVDLRLFTDTSKDIAKYGIGGVAVEHPSAGVFNITIAADVTIKLTEGENAFLEGFILPYKLPVQIDLGKVVNNRANA